MRNMAYGCESLIDFPDISKWDISKVKDISGIFFNCLNLNKLPDISVWNTIEVRDIKNIFNGYKSLISIPDISKWNLNNIEDKNYLSQLFDSFSKSDIYSGIISSSSNSTNLQASKISDSTENEINDFSNFEKNNLFEGNICSDENDFYETFYD